MIHQTRPSTTYGKSGKTVWHSPKILWPIQCWSPPLTKRDKPSSEARFALCSPIKVHAKKRLTHPRFLKIYRDLLSSYGDLIFKTDHIGFYGFSMEAFAESGWEVLEQTDDLLHSEWHDPDVTPEWEEISIDTGCNIFYARVVPPR
ncbi:hypothetical protein [Laceyella tengchongensis]